MFLVGVTFWGLLLWWRKAHLDGISLELEVAAYDPRAECRSAT